MAGDDAARGEPGPLRFDERSVPAPAPVAGREPGSIAFRPASANAGAAGAVPRPAPATPVFGREPHPAHAAAQARARAFDEAAYLADPERIDRHIARLLPFGPASLEGWGARALEGGGEAALRTAALTRRLAELGAAETLRAITLSAAPATGLLDRLKRVVEASPAQKQATLRHLHAELRQLLSEARELAPAAEQATRRLAAHLIALRAVVDVTGAPPDAAFARAVDLKLDALRAALQQAGLAGLHLKSLHDAALVELAQCERLLAVTPGAGGIARPR